MGGMPAWTCEEALAFRDRHEYRRNRLYIYMGPVGRVPSNIGDRGDQLY